MGKRKFLIVVDMQKDFIDGALGTQEAQAMVPAAAARIRECKAAGYTLIATLDTHEEDYMETREGKNLPVPHCIKGSEGHKLYGKIARVSKFASAVFEKGTFGSDALFEYILDGKYDQIELCGLLSNTGVLSNTVIAKTAAPYAKIIVDANCT